MYCYLISIQKHIKYYYRIIRLRKREDMRREEKCKLDEEGKAELHRIAREIKEDKEKEKTKVVSII